MISILSRVGVSVRRMQAATSAIAVAGLEEVPPGSPAGAPDAPWQIIDDRHQILHVLRYILDMQHEVTLTGQSRQRMARSRIVGIDDSPDGHFLIERKADDSAHAALLDDGRVNLGSRFLELPIACAVDISQTAEVQGKSCYRVPLPNWILFSEMRDAWRVRPPEAQALSLSWRPPGEAPITARVIDISEGGIGLLLPQGPSYQPTAGECVHAVLAGSAHGNDGEATVLELDLIHASRHFSGGNRMGAAINPATAEDRQRLHRLIVRHQLLFADLN